MRIKRSCMDGVAPSETLTCSTAPVNFRSPVAAVSLAAFSSASILSDSCETSDLRYEIELSSSLACGFDGLGASGASFVREVVVVAMVNEETNSTCKRPEGRQLRMRGSTSRRSQPMDLSLYLVVGQSDLHPSLSFEDALRAALAHCTIVQLREKTANTGEFVKLARRAKALCDEVR